MRARAVSAMSLFALLLAVYLLAYSGEVQSSDELSMFCVTQSLATRGTTDTEAIRWMGLQPGTYGLDGRLYSKYGLGTSLAAVPLCALGRFLPIGLGAVQTTWLLNAILTALTATLLFLCVIHLGYGDTVAMAAGLLYGLATLAAVYSQSFFSEPLSALSLLATAYFLLRFRTSHRPRDVALAGTALGLALLTRITNAVVVPIFGLVLLVLCWPGRPSNAGRWIVRSWRPILAFAIPLALGALLVAAYNTLRYGNPLQTGYYPLESFSAPFLTGLAGLLFSPGKSLFLYSPILILSVAAFPAFLRRHRVEALLVVGVLAAHLGLYASWFVWHGGHCWGPRFLVPTLPLLALVLAPALVWTGRSRWRMALLGVLVLASGAVQALGMAVSFNRFFDASMGDWGLPVYDPRLFFDPAYSPLLWQVRFLLAGDLFPAWTYDARALLPPLGLLTLALVAMWLVWRGLGRHTARLVSLTLVGACIIAPLMLVALLYPDPRPPRPAYRELAAALDSLVRPGDVVILNASTRTPVLLNYLRAPVRILGLNEAGTLSPGSKVALRQYTMMHRRLWLVTDETVPAAELHHWLSARGYKTMAATYGLAGFTLYAFPLESPPLQALDVVLGEQVTLVSGGVAAHTTPDGVLPVRVEWRPAPAWRDSDRLHLLVQLLGVDGALLVQQDWALVQGAETMLRIGLPIPSHAALGAYQMEVQVYREEDGRRLTTPNGEEAVPLGEVAISTP